MANARNRKLESEIQRVLSALITRDVRDPRVGNVTITGVSLNADKSVALIYFTPFAGMHPAQEVQEGLARAGGFLRGELGRSLRLRHAPRLDFVIDETAEKAASLTSLIDTAVARDKARNPDDKP